MKKLLLALAFSLATFPALAAVTANSPITCQTPNRGIVQFLQGTDVAGTYKTAYTAGSNGSDITAVIVNNNDASATHVVTCQLVNGGVKYGGAVITTVSPAASSFNVLALLSTGVWPGIPVTSDGNPMLRMISGDTLQCTFATALTAADVINVLTTACDY